MNKHLQQEVESYQWNFKLYDFKKRRDYLLLGRAEKIHKTLRRNWTLNYALKDGYLVQTKDARKDILTTEDYY